ncbi:dihydroorotase family protein [Virgibacillus byunsanensis]|uniref:Dihydroorotase family protein n=1 Tax=Virgibacillus byunsanensis TaxID=570945 RepID=A0ABW3LLT7_9BACI
MKYELVVRGKLILEDEEVIGEVGINKGIIVRVCKTQNVLEYDLLQDYDESYVFPGLIDAHVHVNSNPEEGFVSTSSAAAVGGVTTYVDMPYDFPDPITNVERFQQKVEKAENESLVDVGLWATITKTGGTDQIKPLAESGAIAFKFSTLESDPYRFPRIPDDEILKAMELIRETGLRLAFHAENDEIIKGLITNFESSNKVSPRAHMESRPPVSESSAVIKLLEFAYWTNVKLHIVHVSHPRTLDLINSFKNDGVNVTAETCYPYLLLNVSALEEYGSKAKNNPPLREPNAVHGLWNQLLNHKIDLITSDHVAWGRKHKKLEENNIFRSAPGLSGLEIMVPLLFEHLVLKGNVSPIRFAKLMSQNPAEVFSIHGKGKIAEGYDADFTVIDPNKTWTIEEEKLHTNAKLTPFHGTEVKGKVIGTIVRGNVAYNGEEILAEPGLGKIVKGSANKESISK